MSRNQDLLTGRIAPALLSFTMPFLLANLLQTLYGTVDTLTVGNFGSTAGLSAVSTGSQVLGLVTFLAMGLSNGSTVLLGQSIGARDDRRAARVVGSTILCFAALSLALTGLMYLIYPTALSALNVPPEAVEEAYRYCAICSAGIPLIIGYNTVCALLRATGDSKSPLLFVGVACVVNILGDLLLTGWLRMGAAGVAIATVTAQGVSFVFSLFFIMKRGMGFAFSRREIRLHGPTAGAIFRIGIPMGVQSILINLSFMFITAIINAMGLEASAAMGIGDKIVGFAFLPQTAFSAALAVMVAQNIGARQEKRALEAMKVCVAICFGIELAFCAVCQLWPRLLPSLFTDDPVVLTLTGQYMRAYSLDAVLTGVTFCLSGFLNGCGKTTFNLVQNLISTFLGRVPATWLLSRLPGVDLFILGLAAPASTVMSVIMLGIYLAAGFWKKGLYANEAE